MAHRLTRGGRLINRAREMSFHWNGARLTGHEGDTLASALLANGETLMGRSFKYHRPRGAVASGWEEPNALVTLGSAGRMEPNQRATTVELFEGLEAKAQNCWPSLRYDVGAVNAAAASVAPFYSAGFYYKTFMYPRAAWKHVFEPVIRKAAGLGPAPTAPDVDAYEHFYAYCDVLVVGSGPAGLAAAREAGEAGARVILVEQTERVGGRALVETDVEVGDAPASDWVDEEAAALAAMANVTLRTRTQCAGLYDHGYAILYERVADHAPGRPGAPRHRLWRVRARRIVIATGAIERPLAFANNDCPGVMLASAIRDYIALWGVAAGEKIALFANNDDAYRTALAAHDAGVSVAAVVDPRRDASGPLIDAVKARQIRCYDSSVIARVEGGAGGVRAIEVGALREGGRVRATRRIACDAVGMSGGWSPVVHLFSHCGGKLTWDDEAAMFSPAPERGAPIGADGAVNALVAGSADGLLSTSDVLASGAEAGRAAARDCGFRPATTRAPGAASEPAQGPLRPLWFAPSTGSYAHGTKHFIDFQNDVTVADVELAAREGYESVEHAKRYTTLGMATDQGKLSNINGLAILADALGAAIPAVGTTTFRPPYTPISMGAIAGRDAGPLFKPVRKTPIHGWHEAHGADFEPVGDWRRPYCYLREGESRGDAVAREVRATRASLGMLDASTLGKIIVKGPDAGAFLDLIYTNMMSTLKPGRCRYGLMCNENGFLFDDGVVARLSEEEYLLHTTTGGAERVHGWLEEWLQTEWWDLKVHTLNVTEQFAQIAVVGPKARAALAPLTALDLSSDALPFMAHVDGEMAGVPVRIHRISFSGELSYEIATPAGHGLHLWEAIRAAGAAFDPTPYGTEALHVMRAEKGFIMIGDETDGTVTPQDLGLGWAVSKKKADFIGKRAQERSFLAGAGRKQLVGLATEVPGEVLPDGAHAVRALRKTGPMETIGHVTSSYHSPTLGRSIAMALIEDGASRMGEWLDFPLESRVARAQIVDPVFFDSQGEKQNV